MFNFDGCTAIAASNWKKLIQITVCSFQVKTSAVAVLGLVAANYCNSLQIAC